MASDLKEMRVLLSVQAREFDRALAKSEQRIKRFSQNSNKQLSKTTKSFNKLGLAMRGLIPALGAAMLVGKIRSVTAELDEIGKTADNIGLSTDALQELRVVAESSGMSFGEFTKAFQKFTVGIGEATDGTGTANDALQKLGISIYTASGQVKDSEQIFNEVSDALAGFTNESERAGIAADLFGQRVGVKMLNLLRNGSQGMAAMREEARSLGVVIDESLIRKAEATQTQLDLLARILSAQVSSALINLAPLLVNVGEALAWVAEKAGQAYEGFSWALGMNTDQIQNATSAVAVASLELGEMREQLDRLKERAGDSVIPGMAADDIARVTAAIAAQEEKVNSLLDARNRLVDRPESEEPAPFGGSEFSDMIVQYGEMLRLMNEENEVLSLNADARDRARIANQASADAQRLMIAAMEDDGKITEEERAKIEGMVNSLTRERMALLEAAEAQSELSAARGGGTAAAVEQAAAIDQVAEAARAEIEARMAANEQLARSFGDAISQAGSLREALDNVLRLAVKLAATAFLQGLFGIAPQGQSGIASAISGFGARIGGGRAMGGTVSAGGVYPVGENGPELFIPRESGRVLTPAQSRRATNSGAGTVVNMTLNVSTGVQSTVRAEMASMLPQIESVAKRAVIDANQRGGAFRHAITGG